MRLIKKKGNRVTKGSKVRNRGGDDNDNKEVGKRQTESGGDRGVVGGSPGLPLVVAGGGGAANTMGHQLMHQSMHRTVRQLFSIYLPINLLTPPQ